MIHNVMQFFSQEWFEKEVSTCILTNDPECEFTPNYLIEQQLTYFCGSAPECRTLGNYQALNVAKYNAEKYYSVIGITEQMRISLAVLEKYLPKFFSGFLSLYGGLHHFRKANDKVGSNKQPLNQEAKQKLKECLQLDLDFYHFAMQRLHKQAQLLGIFD